MADIENTVNGSIVMGTDEADVIANSGDKVTIQALGGNDSIYSNGVGNSSGVVSITGGDGSDTIENDGNYVVIEGGAGNDSINNYGVNVVINPGAGNDTVQNNMSGAAIVYNNGDGNDFVTGVYNGMTISIGGAKYSTERSGSDVVLTVGNGAITLDNIDTTYWYQLQDRIIGTLAGGDSDTVVTVTAGEEYNNTVSGTMIYGTGNADTITNDAANVTINALAGNDQVYNGNDGSDLKIDLGAGSDALTNLSGRASIVGGEGNDNIQNGYATDQLKANDATIDAGAGADNVDNYGDNALINLGDGNDSLYNVGDKATISAGAGADNVSHFGDDSSIDAGAGDDTVGGYGNNVTVRGGAGNDSLQGYRKNDSGNVKILLDDTQGNNSFSIGYSTNSTINAGAGDDTISADYSNENLLINAGAGNNSVQTKYGDGVTINAGAGADTITINDSSNVSINAGDGANVIENSRINDTTASGHTITSGAGNDSITNRVANALITAGDGNNYVINGAYGSGGGSNVTINTGSGNDFINNYYDYEHARGDKQENVIISSGAGNDTVTNSTDKVTIDGGAGNDEIDSYNSTDVSINGGAGADTIFIANGTVSGGAGNDSISAGDNVLIQYTSGDGNDAIWSFDENSTLSIGGGNYSSVISGEDVVLTVGDSKVTLSNAASLDNLNIIGTYVGDGDTGKNISNTTANTLVTGTNNADTITNSADNVTIQALGGNDSIFGATRGNSNIIIDAGDGNDVIETYGSNISVNAGNGNDSIHIFHNEYATVLAGAGNDTIFNTATDAVLDGGEGNDFIHNDLENVTITGGADDDIIENYGDNVVFNYSAGDGNDLIEGFNETSTLSIGGAAYTRSTVGNDIVLGVGNGSITLQGAADLETLNIIGTLSGGDSDVIENTVAGASVQGTENDDNITNSGNNVTVDAVAGADTITNSGANALLFGGMDDDSIRTTGTASTINGEYGNDSISAIGTASNKLSNVYIYDTIGSNNFTMEYATNSSIYADHSAPETLNSRSNDNVKFRLGDNNVVTSHNDTNVSINASGTISVHNGTGVTVDAGSSADRITISGGDGNKVETGSYADSIVNSGTRTYINTDSGNDTITNSGESSTIYASFGDDVIINTANNVSIDAGYGSDIINNSGDSVQVDDGGDGNDTVTNSGENFVYIYQDGNDSISGLTNSSTVSLGGVITRYSTVASGSDVIVNVGNNQITLAGAATLDNLNIVGDYYDPETTGRYINNTVEGASVQGTAYNDTIDNYHAQHVTIDALDGNDFIQSGGGFEGYLSISAGDGNDTVEASGPANTIHGGKGDDHIYTADDKNLLYGDEGNDTINSDSGNNVTINGGDGNDSIKNDSDNSLVDAGAGNDTVRSNGNYSTVLAGSGNDLVDNNTRNTSIDGGAGDDIIFNDGGYLTMGDDVTIRGGAGNDTISNMGGTDWNSSLNSNTDEIIWFPKGSIGLRPLLDGGAGNDLINNYLGTNGTILGGAGNDTIANSGSNTSIDAGDGNDYIENTDAEHVLDNPDGSWSDTVSSGFQIYDIYPDAGKHVTITGGKGDDTIDNYAESVTFKYSTGDGNDSISGMNSTSQFVIDNGEGKYKSVESGDDVLIGVGNATITLSGAAALDTLLIDGVYDGVLDTSTPDTTPAEQGVIITNETSDTVITGTENADTITNSGNDVTITPDAGDDLVSLAGGVSGVQINYTSGDGNDSIVGFNASSTLSVGDSAYSTQVSGNDLIITVGESKITLVDAANLSNPNIESTNPVVLLVEMILKRTAAGYPVASGIFLNPDEIIGEEPDNYATKEAWNITSADNLNLHGVCYKPENSNDKWVVLVHGYGLNHKSMYPFTYFYLANGYNVLMIDQRAAGESDGTWLTMGAAESQDVALWTQEIARRNSNAKITLHGVSMGSATAMLTAARSDATNVTSLIEDCGYTDAIKLFNVIGDAYLGISSETVAAMDSVGHGMMGYYLHDASPIGSISSVKMPTLFISGDDDGVVPVSMLSELYDASGAEVKEVFTVKGAGHAQAGLNDPVGYSNAVFRFVAEANGEGWNTENVADDISLRGTKYNDTIANSGDNVTINTAAGDDYISLSGASNVIDYTSGDGSDIVAGLSSTDTVSISGSAYTTLTSGSDVIISVGEGSITLQGAADLETLNIIGTYDTQPVDGGVNIVNETSNTVITGTANNDTIINRASSVTVQALAGNDSIHNNGNSVTIDAGAGSDTINNYGDNVLIDVGAGNDSVMNHGEGVSIIGGKGNDNLFSSTDNGTVFRYAAGDGFDTIRNFDSADTLLIADSDFTTTKIGDDIVVTVGEGSITVRGAGLLESPNIIGEGSEPADEGVDITNTTNDTVITGTAESDTITNSGVRVTVRTFAGDDYIANVVDSSVTTATLGNVIDAGDGSDTIYNYHTYNPTLLGGNGDDSIVVSRGHLTFADGGDGNDTIEGQPVETLESSNWSFGGHATILGGAGDDLIIPIYANNSSIDGGAGDDTIIGNGKDATIDGGAGNNFIELTTVEGGATGQIIVFNGKTTVEGFNTGFGEGSDTVYIKGDAPAVDFKADGLTLYYEDKSKSLTFADITETTGFNIYYEAYDEYTKEVFIADDDWYDVSDGAADYYVGATAKKHHGIDFSSVSSNVNVTLDTDYESTEATFWVNNVYSIKGGAGLTTITGSAKSDTIVSGSGSTTINAGAGNDLLTGNGKTVFNIDDGATTTVYAAAGDTINADDTVRFIKDGIAHIVDGKLASVSPDAIVNINGNVSVGSAVDDVTVVDGEETTLTAADAKIFVGPNGATLSGYDIDTNAFVIDAADADDISEKIIYEELGIDRGTFHAANQADVLLEDLDTSKGTFVKFITADGKKNIFGWDPQGGGLLDGSDVNGKQILFGAAPGGISTVRGGSKNDTIFTGANGTVSLSGGTDIVYLEGKNAELRLGDGTVDGTARIVYGFSTTDTVTVNDAEDLSVKVVKDTLRLRKNDSVLIFDELTNFEGANGLQVQSGDETYTLRTDYDGGLTKADYFWQDDANNFYRPDSTLVINDDGTRKEYFIEEGSGRIKIDDFDFANDAINLKSIDGLTYMGSNLFIKPSDDDWVVIENGAGKNINVNIGGEKFVGQLGKQLTYDDDVTNYIGEKISVSAAQVGDIDIDLSDDKFCDVHVLDASAFNGDATLIGGDLDDKITASKGAASLWGGVGGNDILIGNGAGNTFHYLLGGGNDEIRDAHDGDAINLLDVTLADIASADVNSWGVRLTMNDGGTLTVNSTADVTYNLSDGSFKANHQSREWQQA